jgi:hypothetical protein
MSSGHAPAVNVEEDEVAPWDSARTVTIVIWAVVVAAFAWLFPFVLNMWSEQILHAATTRGG